MTIRKLLRLGGATVALLLAFSTRGNANEALCSDNCAQWQSSCDTLLEPEWFCEMDFSSCVNQCIWALNNGF